MKQRVAKIVSVGEAMVEFAPAEKGLFQRAFAGDTFNTAWHMAQALGERAEVSFVTRVGSDKLSDEFVSELDRDGLKIGGISRDTSRTMGLYTIQLDGFERSFSYWRENSAARCLADNPERLNQSLQGAEWIHLSGITLAILPPDARENLKEVFHTARLNGAVVSFDPNIRPALWSSKDEIRNTLISFFDLTDIALPSFDDEAAIWDDATPEDTLTRFAGHGVREIVVKNGADAVWISFDGDMRSTQTPVLSQIRDTTGAGDAFNAGYLGARVLGKSPFDAVVLGQTMSACVLKYPGARIPKEFVPEIT